MLGCIVILVGHACTSPRTTRSRTPRAGCGPPCSGANDGILSTASLLLGVAAAHASRDALVVAGIAGLVGGAASMAAGEYVSVSSQADSEQADLNKEKQELATDAAGEHAELAAIYVGRGLTPDARRPGRHPAGGQGRAGRACAG